MKNIWANPYGLGADLLEDEVARVWIGNTFGWREDHENSKGQEAQEHVPDKVA